MEVLLEYLSERVKESKQLESIDYEKLNDFLVFKTWLKMKVEEEFSIVLNDFKIIDKLSSNMEKQLDLYKEKIE